MIPSTFADCKFWITSSRIDILLHITVFVIFAYSQEVSAKRFSQFFINTVVQDLERSFFRRLRLRFLQKPNQPLKPHIQLADTIKVNKFGVRAQTTEEESQNKPRTRKLAPPVRHQILVGGNP